LDNVNDSNSKILTAFRLVSFLFMDFAFRGTLLAPICRFYIRDTQSSEYRVYKTYK